jgi:hypothetical protein
LRRSLRDYLRAAAVLFGLISLVIISKFPTFAAGNMLYFPLISRIMPGGPVLNSPVLISEVLYDPFGVEPGGEWIELYNRSAKTVSLDGYKIGDSETRGDEEGMYLFPKGTYLSPGGILIVANRAINFADAHGYLPDFELSDSSPAVPDLTKYRSWAGGVINLNNSGDEIFLLDPNDTIMDNLSWGSSSMGFTPPIALVISGHSLERVPANVDHNHAGDWGDQSNPQPGSVRLFPPEPHQTATQTPTEKKCDTGDLLITELLYDPSQVSEPAGEWFEVFNYGESPIRLDCFKIGDEESQGGGEGMYMFPTGYVLDAGEVVVIANRGDIFFSLYNFKPQFELNESADQIPNMTKYSLWATGPVNLNKTGDELILLDAYDQVVDAVSWGNSTAALDPPIPNVVEGSSLERRPANRDTDSAGDWLEQASPDPGLVDLTEPTLQPSPTISPTPEPIDIPNLVINEIHAKPHSYLGDANGDGDVDAFEDEFVELINNSLENLDISGWVLKVSNNVRHVFSPESSLAPGCGILIFGGGEPADNFGNFSVQVASSGNLVLNDFGDTISLFNLESDIISLYTYREEARDNQSITRDPDIIGEPPLVKHSTATGSGGSLFSPGTRIDGGLFSGCSDSTP